MISMMATQGNLQNHTGQLSSINPSVLASGESLPINSSANLIGDYNNARNNSLPNSTLNLTSSLTNLSLMNSNLGSINEDSFTVDHDPNQFQQVQQQQLHHQQLQQLQQQQHQQQQAQQKPIESAQQYTLKIKNLPSDITVRESYCIFAFAKDFIGLDLLPDSNNLPVIYARFKTLSSASNYSQILESNQIFGPTYQLYLKSEIIDTSISSTQPVSEFNLGATSKRAGSSSGSRSRFLFSDPFNSDSLQEHSEVQNIAGQLQTGSSQVNNTNGIGKSFLILDTQQEVRDYDQLVRDSWKQPPGSAPNQTNLQNTRSASIASGSIPGYANSQPQTPSGQWDRRRQNSAFFNNSSPLLTTQLSSSGQTPSQLTLSSQVPPPSQTLSQVGSSLQLSSSNPSVPSTSSTSNLISPMSQVHNLHLQQPQNQHQTQQQILQQQQQQNQQQQNLQTMQNQQHSQTQTQNQTQSQTQQPSQQSLAQSTSSTSQQSSQVDLSLLARVPPPANPADHNPPCNTLYVGNLPPDATESELRQLFSPQAGFKRLSFRTKVQPPSSNGVTTSHAHGPMCFVEFEDVAHATRALAELYGRTLPRPGGVPGKGGIRLSFSKNPLGVRGPGQRRTSGFGSFQGGFKN